MCVKAFGKLTTRVLDFEKARDEARQEAIDDSAQAGFDGWTTDWGWENGSPISDQATMLLERDDKTVRKTRGISLAS